MKDKERKVHVRKETDKKNNRKREGKRERIYIMLTHFKCHTN